MRRSILIVGIPSAVLAFAWFTATSIHSTPPPLPSGDVDCSGNVDSADAALILQHEAALLIELPCPEEADVNLDGIPSSIDAAIVLQREAGLRPEPEGGLNHHFLIDGEIGGAEVFVEFSIPIELELVITNTSADAISRFFTTSQRFDFRAGSGAQKWHWSHGQAFDPQVSEQSWEPGASVSYQATWDQRDNDGQRFPQGRGSIEGRSTGCTRVGTGVCGPNFGVGLNILAPHDGCARGDDWLIARLQTGQDEFSLGEDIPLTLTVTNCSDDSITRTTSSSQLYDFFILDDQGEFVWFWSHDRAFAQAIVDLEYSSEPTTVYEEIWQQDTNAGNPVAPGTFEVRAVLHGSNQTEPLQHRMVDRLFIEIVP